MLNKNCIRFAIVLLSFMTSTAFAVAQSTEGELKAIILQRDSLFWNGYNKCDTTLCAPYLSENLEFFHDKGGITRGKAALQLSLKKNLCSRADWRLRREAVPGTVAFYPLTDNGKLYGAILQGEHYFYITEKGKPEYRTGRANFNHLWLVENGQWVMVRILSYNHREADQEDKKSITVPVATLQQWAGTYDGPKTTRVVIAAAENSLLIKNGKGTLAIYPESASKYFSKERNLTFEFVAETTPGSVSLKVSENGSVAEELKRVK
ncbi:nuclear transport factor 2 family protein [Paraflavitalea sp. CAU 1676]|uniref:nuclear transport factor 2 family protein n=1 Tax=Paraflavitalea sp. CAU 1676 TaxID=3032598 RepID=UPI0023DC839E|nr:nuclear transport factor 2 family protein [Paraflavitalea sp. CAU 1676]MDF2192037.1 nuclear transport factor 2 family protein [Paraflavitalea sp. CAU 1676]